MYDFILHRGSGAKANGTYIQPLNMSSKSRNDASTSKVITTVPPGCSCTEVLRRFLRDVQRGITRVFVSFDALGIRRRVFMDFVDVIGDTTAIYRLLDVRGHSEKEF